VQWPGSIVPVLDLASRRCDDRLVVWLLDNLKEITIALFRVWNAWKGLAVQTSNCCLHLNLICHYNQNEGQSHNMKIDNSSFERVEDFKHLGTNLTNQNSIKKEIKSRLKSGNACYHSAQNLLSSSLLSKNLKNEIHRTIILPVVLYRCETWSFTLREECRLWVFENRVLRRIFGPNRKPGNRRVEQTT